VGNDPISGDRTLQKGTTLETLETSKPRTYIGCLSCYNNGRLTGRWIDAETASAEMESDDITYGGQASPGTYGSGAPGIFCNTCHGDEFDAFDYENIPSSCGTVRSFYDNATYLSEMDDDLRERLEILSSWLGGGLTLEELATYDEDNYRGQWDSFKEYAEQYAEEVGDLRDLPDHLAWFIDWQAYADWLEQDYYFQDGHIWRSC